MTISFLRTALMVVIRSRQANPKWGDIFITLEHTLICKYLGQTMVFYAEEKRKDIIVAIIWKLSKTRNCNLKVF